MNTSDPASCAYDARAATGAGPGTVHLVGAGPGDPGLLTRHGAEALAAADVVVYDRLADSSMLSLAPADAEMIYVGKQAAVHAVPQPRINEILAEQALLGRAVVRLKGGDPFVFGRGGEEASYLRERGIRFVIVPGVSSAVAAPAYAGIPVTDRRLASSFAVITGHEDPTKPASRLDWAGIAAGADTLVFLMGLTNLPAICARLVAEGRPPETPAAVIERGTTPGQRVVTGTLADLPELVTTAGLHPPALTVVGDVVRLREVLAWHDTQPLAGRRVLVPRVRPHPSELVRLLKSAGAETEEVPVLRSEPLPAEAGLLDRLTRVRWLIVTAPAALDGLLQQLCSLGEDVRALRDVRLAAVGPTTAAHLRAARLRVDFAPSAASAFAAGFCDTHLDADDAHTLVIGEEYGVDRVRGELQERGGAVAGLVTTAFVADRRAPLPPLDEFHAIALASSGTARALAEAYSERPGSHCFVAAMGPTTSAVARELGIRIDAEAGEPAPAALAELVMRRLGPLEDAR